MSQASCGVTANKSQGHSQEIQIFSLVCLLNWVVSQIKLKYTGKHIINKLISVTDGMT